MNDILITQVWIPRDADPAEFARSVCRYFLDGMATHIPLVPDAHPSELEDGSQLFEVRVPVHREDELDPFLRDYAAKHGFSYKNSSASGFGYSHSG